MLWTTSTHHKRKCPKSKQTNGQYQQKQDLTNITCHFCRQKGHHANKCPKRQNKSNDESENNKAVSFKSAHLMKEQEKQSNYYWKFLNFAMNIMMITHLNNLMIKSYHN